MTSRGPLPFCHANIRDNRSTLSLEEKDNRIHVGSEEAQETAGLVLGDNDLTAAGNG